MRTLKGLYVDSINIKPNDYGFYSEKFGEDWEFWEAVTCEECGGIVVSNYSGERHCDLDSNTDCEAEIWGIEGPMMSYWYPLEISDFEDAASKIVGLPLCVVRVNNQTGVALTGGGMDLSWEICEAFMLLGQLPPLHFCQLPNMAGKKLDSRNRWILSGAAKSAKIASLWAKGTSRHVRELRKQLKEN